jgi:hypothetical protein
MKLVTARAVKAMKAGETHPAALAKSPGTLSFLQSVEIGLKRVLHVFFALSILSHALAPTWQHFLPLTFSFDSHICSHQVLSRLLS